MTDEDGAKLKHGDRVWAWIGGQKRQATVIRNNSYYPILPVTDCLGSPYNRVVIGLRRDGHDTVGRLFPVFFRLPCEIELVSKWDPYTANVFADFLAERGYDDAARTLRKEFPLS